MLVPITACLAFVSLTLALPPNVPLELHEGFWFGDFVVGPQTFNLTIDTGSFAILIEEGKYKPSATTHQTNLGEFIQFNGASQDGVKFASETIFYVRDNVTFAGANASQLLVGNITSGDPLPGDGVAGFSPPSSASELDDPTFSPGQGLFETLCDNGTGRTRFLITVEPTLTASYYSVAVSIWPRLWNEWEWFVYFWRIGWDTTQIEGNITTLPTTPQDSWSIQNSTEEDSAIIVVDGQAFGHIIATFDSGTPNVIGPLDDVRNIMEAVGYNITQQASDGITVAFGTYDCSRTPARFGFLFPPNQDIHYIDIDANVLNRTVDGKVCTANILGTSTMFEGQWSIGQTWFQGRYVQHDLTHNTISFADLA
ncbi:hypothetical protein D9757_011299 [Collybiopsis confluens]|uniref:Peptidase A1 domain-containing protein n=1 Tax=Collybiopsis confluens TaxID=2823264 RepID=A0A8H5GNJ0_9AGAR|nr:hypothetical protein D9757_011299 [Collybiopsis confluens]